MNAHLRAFRTLVVCGALALLITAVLTTTAAAFVCMDGTPTGGACPAWSWPGGLFTYRTNAASFATNLKNAGVGLDLNQVQVDYWIPHALNMWKERTGIGGGLRFVYDGGGSTASNSSCTNADNTNQVYAVAGCHPTLGCGAWAVTQPGPIVGNSFTETDICVYGGSVGAAGSGCLGEWRVRADNFPSNDKDLIGALVHEFGHALGLHHTNNTVMDSPTFFCGNTLARFPYGDDIRGMRTIYPVDTSRQRRWSEMTSTTWSSPVAIPGGAYTHTRAAVGKRGSGQNVVATRIGLNGDTIHFTRATYPVSSGSAWTNQFYSQNTWRPPSVAGRPSSYSSSELWVAAWADVKDFATSCSRIRVGVSTNAFATMPTIVDLDQACGSVHEPSIAFDKNSGRFVLVYVRHKLPTDTLPNIAKMYARTSLDGVTWTNPKDLGTWTIDAVDIACAASGGTCLISYIDGGRDWPFDVNRQITVSSSGSITLGSSTTDTYTEWTPGAGVRTYGGVNDWFLSAPLTSCTTHGSCDNFTTRDPIIPFPNFTSAGVIVSKLRGTFASVPEFSRMYSWVVQ